MKITWYGTASLVLEAEGTVLAIDPFCKLPVGSLKRNSQTEKLHEREYSKAEYVLVTHGHLDHIYHIPMLYGNSGSQIYCTATPYATLRRERMPRKQLHIIRPGWKKALGPFVIEAYQGRHCRFDWPLICSTVCRPVFWRHPVHLLRLLKIYLKFPENGEILFYEISCQGWRIQVMGSMNLDNDTVYPTGADILILPLQGRSDQNEYALQFAERLRPGQIRLDHYDNAFPPISDEVDTSGFVKNVRERCGICCRPLREGRTLELRPRADRGGKRTWERRGDAAETEKTDAGCGKRPDCRR